MTRDKYEQHKRACERIKRAFATRMNRDFWARVNSAEYRNPFSKAAKEAPTSYHRCEFICPGFGDELWCKHDGCKRTKPRWERVGWNVGDRVMTYNGGEGTVVSVTGNKPYPVKVDFDRGGSETFTAEGQRYTERSSYADDLRELKE